MKYFALDSKFFSSKLYNALEHLEAEGRTHQARTESPCSEGNRQRVWQHTNRLHRSSPIYLLNL